MSASLFFLPGGHLLGATLGPSGPPLQPRAPGLHGRPRDRAAVGTVTGQLRDTSPAPTVAVSKCAVVGFSVVPKSHNPYVSQCPIRPKSSPVLPAVTSHPPGPFPPSPSVSASSCTPRAKGVVTCVVFPTWLLPPGVFSWFVHVVACWYFLPSHVQTTFHRMRVPLIAGPFVSGWVSGWFRVFIGTRIAAVYLCSPFSCERVLVPHDCARGTEPRSPVTSLCLSARNRQAVFPGSRTTSVPVRRAALPRLAQLSESEGQGVGSSPGQGTCSAAGLACLRSWLGGVEEADGRVSLSRPPSLPPLSLKQIASPW